MVTINTQFHLAYNLSRKNKLKTSWMKKRVEADVQMVREYLNVIIIHSKYFPDSDWLKAHV